jgi:hypothetical protein
MPCGRFEAQPSVATVSRLTQAGVALVNTRVAVLEAMADNAHPKAKEIYATLPAGLVTMDDARGKYPWMPGVARRVQHGRAELRGHRDRPRMHVAGRLPRPAMEGGGAGHARCGDSRARGIHPPR